MTTRFERLLARSADILADIAARGGGRNGKLAVNRRQFIVAGTSATALQALQACATPGASEFYGNPRVTCSDNRITIEHAGGSWTIDGRWFGVNCVVRCDPDIGSTELNIGDRLEITARGGTFPGLDVEIGLRMRLYYEYGRWQFGLVAAGTRFTSAFSLADWVRGSARITHSFSWFEYRQWHKWAKGFGLTFGQVDSIRLHWSADWHFEIDSYENHEDLVQGKFPWGHAVGAGIRAQLICLLDDAQSRVDSYFDQIRDQVKSTCTIGDNGANAPAAMIYWFAEPKLSGTPTLFCGSHGESLSIHDSDLDEVVFVTYGDGLHGIAVSLRATPGGVAACIDGKGAQWMSGLPLDAWAWHDLRGDAGNEGVFNASVAREKNIFTFHGNTLSINGRNDIDGPFAANFCGDVCDSYMFTFNLYEAYLAIHDIDFSCLKVPSIVGISLDPINDSTPGDVTSPTMWSADNGSFRAPLDIASLRVLRAVDFAAMTFSFKNLDLKIAKPTIAGVATPKLHLHRGAPDTSPPNEAQTAETGLPLLAIELSPQYVAEQAFFRQLDPGHQGADQNGQRTGSGSGAPGDLMLDAYLDETRKYHVDADGRASAPLSARTAKLGTDVDIKASGTGYQGNLLNELPGRLNNPRTPSVETRLAGASRLVFDVGTRIVEDFEGGDNRDQWRQYEEENLPRALSFAALTNFDGLRPAVNRRALDRDAALASQLAVAGLNKDMSRADVRAAIADSVKKPGPFETSIEIVYRLQVSPSMKSRWVSCSGSPHPVTGMISPWHVSLQDDAAAGCVRAIWSPDFDENFIKKDDVQQRQHPAHSNHAPWKPPGSNHTFRMSLDARDRHELVALSSVYGLPALPRIDPDNPSGQVDPDDHRGVAAVLPGPDDYQWLITDALDNREGFYVPRPLDRAQMTLTSYGAFAQLQGAWEPPAAISKLGVDPMWPAFTVERWKHDIVMGRDTDVEIVYKGFLFPLGYRAALVKTTQRRFELHPRYHYPIAVLIQRMFIIVSSPVKNFPAIGQMNAGRGWHCNALELLTTRTPDIVDPFDATRRAGNGNIKQQLNLVGEAFWPRVRETKIQRPDGTFDNTKPGNEVRFKYRLDDDATRTESPLLFIDNTAAHNPRDIEKLQKYYDDLADVAEHRPYVTAGFEGQRIAYAESLNPGDTTFETFSWLLSAKGREPHDGTVSETGVFYMDAIMEGADQPPFYPFMKSADIRAQSIAALSGNGTGRVQVAYDGDYLKVGFGEALEPGGYDEAGPSPTPPGRGAAETQKNPSQIYLLVTAGPPSLNFSSNGGKSGGIAKPNLTVSALSRSQGVVGGSPTYTQSAGVAAFAATQTPLNGRALANAGLEKAKSGNFDPGEFFGGALADAKLLGLIKLQDILKVTSFADAAPQLLEEIAYSLPIEEMANSARIVVKRILGTIEDVERQLNSIELGDINWRSLYSTLGKCIDEIKAPLKKADTILLRLNGDADNDIKVFNDFVANLNGFMGAIKALSAEVNRITKNPVPVIVTDKINELKQTLGLLRRSLEALSGNEQELLKKIGEQLRKEVADRVRDGIKTHYKNSRLDEKKAMDYIATYLYGKPIYLGNPEEPINDTLFSLPPFDELGRPNVDALRDSLLFDTVGEPLMRAFETLRRLDRSKQDTLKILGEALIDSLEAVSELDEVQRFAEQIKDKVTAKCSELMAPLTGGLQASVDAVGFYVEDVRSAFKLIIELDPDAIIRDVRVSSYVAANGVRVQAHTTISAQEARDALRNLQAQLQREDRRLAELLIDLQRFDKELTNNNACGVFGKETAVAMTRMQNIRRDILVRAEAIVGAMISGARFLDYAAAQNGFIQGRVSTLSGNSTRSIPWDDIKKARELIETVMPEFAVSMTSANAFIENMVRRKDVYIRLFKKRGEDYLEEIKSDPRVQELAAFEQAVETFKNAAINIDSFDNFLAAAQRFEAANTDTDVKDNIKRFREALETGRAKFMAARNAFDTFKTNVDAFKATVEGEIADAERFVGRVKGTAEAFQRQVDALSTNFNEAIAPNADPRKRLDAVKSAATLLSQYDRRFLAHFSQGEAFFQGVANHWRKRFDRTACDALSPVVEFIFVTHNGINTGLKKLADVITSGTGANQEVLDDVIRLLKLVLSDKVIAFVEAISLDADARANGIRAGVKKDTAEIKAVWDEFAKVRQLEDQHRSDPYHPDINIQREKAVKAARELHKRRFSNGGPPDLTILKLPDQVNGVLDLISAGDVGQLIDLSKLERALKDALISFLPTRINLSYDMGTDISPFPAGEPIFEIGGSGTRFKKEQYGGNENAEKDLFIEGRGGIDLVTKEKNFSVKSHIQPFKLNLFPSFDAVTIEFEGVRFTVDEGGSDFKVKVKRVEIGSQLAYLQELAKALNPATGPYVEFIFSPLGIEAGFRLSIGSFSLGVLAFSNIALGVSCELPLDSREALFRFALSSRSRPFLISVPPYGGGGFFAMKTQATDIVFMAASFEFGGVGDLSFGPLRAQARATTGMYVEKDASRGTTIEGFFIAVGEAQIACFSISAALGLILRHEPTGIMKGIAFYSFEFKVSFFKIHYGVTVEKILSGGGNHAAPAAIGRQYVITRQQIASNAIPLDGEIIDVMVAKTSSVFEDRHEGETVSRRIYRMCKRHDIDINDDLVVACVESRKNWRTYRKTYG